VLSDELGLTLDEPPTVNTRDRKLVYRQVPDGEYYWELPETFKGNKVRNNSLSILLLIDFS